MNFKFALVVFAALAFTACHQTHQTEGHDEHEEGHSHEAEEHGHEEVKFQYTAYSTNYELFAEADPFVVGEEANVLSHFTVLPGFRPLEAGKVTATLSVNGQETKQTLESATKKGIYSFSLKPATAGKGTLKYEITDASGTSEIIVPEVAVFSKHEEGHEAAEAVEMPKANTTTFTKEQSWKIDFATDHPSVGPFGQTIKTTALIEPANGDEITVNAKTNGIVHLTSNNLYEGQEVRNGQTLFTISGTDMADNNLSVKISEARNNFEKAKTDYERAKDLSKDKIVSEKDLRQAQNNFENAKAAYDNLNHNFTSSGQAVSSSLSGYVKHLYVKNGSYVQAGQPLLVVSQNKALVLKANVPQKYASLLGSIQSANLRTIQDNQTYTLEQLNGKILSYGKSADTDNYQIPVTLQVDNKGSFIPGSFVEVYLKSVNNEQAISVPTTALLEEQGLFFVWVQVTPERFEKREVGIGQNDGINVEITRGVTDKERIVTKGAMLIKLAQATGTLDAHSGHVH